MRKYNRIFLIVLDSLGIGAMADSEKFGDVGVNTFGHIWESQGGLEIPNLRRLGMGNLCGVTEDEAKGYARRLNEASNGKDTMTGHWEMMGIYTTKPFVTFTDHGFPKELIDELEKRTGRKIIGNKAASGTEISLDLLEKLCFEPELAGWNGIGFVIQAYQKRCPLVIDYLIDLATRSRRRLMIRLVKGAYWDSEIKRAQMDGLEGYPVYTRKVYTDVSYLACAKKLLAVPNLIYPQFATHNAHTLAAIYQLAGQNYYPGQYEFQCLHGMGEPLYEQVTGKVADGKLNRPCRIYAPVGTHETLLAYLVRRLLENGANTSFVNRIADTSLPLDELVADPVTAVEKLAQQEGQTGLPHPKIPLPRDLYGHGRDNSAGLDPIRILRDIWKSFQIQMWWN